MRSSRAQEEEENWRRIQPGGEKRSHDGRRVENRAEMTGGERTGGGGRGKERGGDRVSAVQ